MRSASVIEADKHSDLLFERIASTLLTLLVHSSTEEIVDSITYTRFTDLIRNIDYSGTKWQSHKIEKSNPAACAGRNNGVIAGKLEIMSWKWGRESKAVEI